MYVCMSPVISVEVRTEQRRVHEIPQGTPHTTTYS
jgi:hypothetical protein